MYNILYNLRNLVEDHLSPLLVASVSTTVLVLLHYLAS